MLTEFFISGSYSAIEVEARLTATSVTNKALYFYFPERNKAPEVYELKRCRSCAPEICSSPHTNYGWIIGLRELSEGKE